MTASCLERPEPEQADARHQRHPRQRIEHFPRCADARILAYEIGSVSLDVGVDRLVHGARESIRLAILGRSNHERPILGADGMVRRDHAGLAVARKLSPVDVVENCGPGAEVQDQTPPRSFDLIVPQAAGAAQDRSDHGDRGDRLGQMRADEHRLAVLVKSLLGKRNQGDHTLVGFARGFAEGEDAVLVQDQALDLRIALEHVGRHLRKGKARHDVRYDADAPVIELGADVLAVGLVDQAQDRAGVGVIDEFVRQERVQERFDRWVGSRRIEQILALHTNHIFVAQRVACAQPAQAIEPNRRKSCRLDRRHVGARPFDAERHDLLAEQVRHRRLNRGVAAAVQHEPGIAAEEAGGIDPQREIGTDAAIGIVFDRRLRLAIDPAAFHRQLLSGPTRPSRRACIAAALRRSVLAERPLAPPA